MWNPRLSPQITCLIGLLAAFLGPLDASPRLAQAGPPNLSLISARSCADYLKRTGAWQIGSEVAEIHSLDQVLPGPWYILGKEDDDTLLLVLKSEDVFLRLPLSKLAQHTFPVLPKVITQDGHPTCFGTAVANALRSLGHSINRTEKKEIWRHIHDDSPVTLFGALDGQFTAAGEVIAARGIHFTSHQNHPQSLKGLISALGKGAVGVYTFTGTEVFSHEITSITYAKGRFYSQGDQYESFRWSKADHETKQQGHAIFVRALLPDGRLLVADWGQWKVLKPTDLTSAPLPGSGSSGGALILWPNELLHHTSIFGDSLAPSSLTLGSRVQFTMSPWHGGKETKVQGTLIEQREAPGIDGGRIVIFDEKNGAIHRLEGPFSDEKYHVISPATVETRAEWRELSSLTARDEPALLVYQHGFTQTRYEAGRMSVDESGQILFKGVSDAVYQPLKRDGLISAHTVGTDFEPALKLLHRRVSD